jgi:hypothetical protein
MPAVNMSPLLSNTRNRQQRRHKEGGRSEEVNGELALAVDHRTKPLWEPLYATRDKSYRPRSQATTHRFSSTHNHL